jgi:hypothetical protein
VRRRHPRPRPLTLPLLGSGRGPPPQRRFARVSDGLQATPWRHLSPPSLINLHQLLSDYYQFKADCCQAVTVSSHIVCYQDVTVHELPRRGTAQRPGARISFCRSPSAPPLHRRCGNSPGLLLSVVRRRKLQRSRPPRFLCTFIRLAHSMTGPTGRWTRSPPKHGATQIECSRWHPKPHP